ncbi:MAG: hypothetical protein CL678_18950 [Bdellovibrionaceae bacterium]|nr:hypothetical protein [Pseudobdellovibrionaceae bacterium]|tara:strand:+ start:2158 stop:2607 length:450 start_codon:yes stop_codon:yes gene_type:complete
MASTDANTVKNLCKSILTRLENDQSICLETTQRAQAFDSLYEVIRSSVLTEDDLRKKTFASMGLSKDSLEELTMSEAEQYRAARRAVRKDFAEDELNGLYFQSTLRDIAIKVIEFLMSAKEVDEVFASDDELNRAIVLVIKKFNPNHLH